LILKLQVKELESLSACVPQQNIGKKKCQTQAEKLLMNLILMEYTMTKSQLFHQPLVTIEDITMQLVGVIIGKQEIASCSNKQEKKFITKVL